LGSKAAISFLFLQRDVNQPIFAGDHAFAVAIDLRCADHIARGVVNGCDIMRAVVIGKYAVRLRVVIDAIAAFADFYLLDELEVSGIEHRDFVLLAVAGEAFLRS
jgi:hypothetical protein